jgi:O-antigen/teichoic acid export membrane protein
LFVLAWGAGAYIGCVVASFQARAVPSLVGATYWLVRHNDLGPRYLAENAGGNAASTVQSYCISSILGLTDVGYIQAANVFMGPFKIIYFGLSMITIPEAARILKRSPRELPVFCMAASAGVTVVALAWTGVLFVALPMGLGHLMLGNLWRPAYPLVLPTALATLASCAGTGGGVGLHALGAARRSLRATIITTVLGVGLTLVGAFAGGAAGTLYFAAAAAWLGTLVSWWTFRAAMHESGTVPIPAWLFPPRSGGRHKGPAAARGGQDQARALSGH